MNLLDYFFPKLPTDSKPKKGKQPRFSDRQIAEIFIATLEAQLNEPEILAILRPGLVEGLNTINEIIAEHEGQIIDPAQFLRPSPKRRTIQRY